MMSTQLNNNKVKNNGTFTFFILSLGILLNQSNIMFGLNISFADIVLVVLTLLLLVNNSFDIPHTSLILFLIFSTIILINTVFFVPSNYNIILIERTVILDFIKLIVIFLYFIMGYLLSKFETIGLLLKAFSIGAVFIGLLGILNTFIQISYLSEIMFFAGSRLRGFMNDPNFFSVIQISALAVIVRLDFLNKLLKNISISIIILSVISSGSKTGMITLVCYFLYWMVNNIIEGKMKGRALCKVILVLFLVLIISPYLTELLTDLLGMVTGYFPIFDRVELLITNFDESLNSEGSGREMIWKTGIDIIKSSPIVGIGIGGNYISVSHSLSGIANVAHNTYIQMAAEWGLPVTLSLMIYIYSIILKPKKTNNHAEVIYTVREMLFAFLISSLSLSFNNSRLFWLLIGVSTYYLFSKEREIS